MRNLRKQIEKIYRKAAFKVGWLLDFQRMLIIQNILGILIKTNCFSNILIKILVHQIRDLPP